MKSTKDIQNRSVDAFKELDSITKEQAPQSNTQPKAVTPSVPPAVSQAKPAEAITPVPEPKINLEPGLITEPPAQVENANPVAPVTKAAPNQNPNLPIKESEKSFMNSVQAAGPDTVIVKKPDGTQEVVPLVQSNNPEYVARRAEALRKPGAVIGQATVR
jgi:hypothetical protein